MTEPQTMTQGAPYPAALAGLVARARYRPGWTFYLGDIDRGQGSRGLTLDIVTCGYDAYHPDRGENYRVHHFMIVPAEHATPPVRPEPRARRRPVRDP